MNLFEAFILGLVEGITEFLPISSTGHLILVSHVLDLGQGKFEKTFEISIQLGAILAVCIFYFEKLKCNVDLWKKIFVAFLPTGVIGLLLHGFVERLFDPLIVSTMLIIGGIVFILVEMFEREHFQIEDLSKISYVKAFLVGVFQSFAMIPGTSRSGATIVGGLILGLDRKVATEFSFLLAIPTMFAATGFELVKNVNYISITDLKALFMGFFVAFISAYLSVRWLLNFISAHTFIPFGIYRVVVGCFCFLWLV